MATETHIEWTSPAALWEGFGGVDDAERRVFRTPAILRFASDQFMPDLMDLLQVDPRRLADHLAVPEQWDAPLPETEPLVARKGILGQLDRARNVAVRRLERRGINVPLALTKAQQLTAGGDAPKPLKLYQPAHQRYYLVAASLICRTLGLPDRPLNTSANERVTFVIRRLVPGANAPVDFDPEDAGELAMVNGRWVAVPANDKRTLVAGEEQYPLTPLVYPELDGRRRRMLNGFIPIGKRETLLAARMPVTPEGLPAPEPIDARQMLLKQQVLGPWAQIEVTAENAQRGMSYEPSANPPADIAQTRAFQDANNQLQMVSWYVLLDFNRWLKTHANDFWQLLMDPNAQRPAGTRGELWDALSSRNDPAAGITLRDALRFIDPYETQLEDAKTKFSDNLAGWPQFRFLFARLVPISPHVADGSLVRPTSIQRLSGDPGREDLEGKIVRILDNTKLAIPVRAIAQINAQEHTSAPWFTVRCVFERPNCATLSPPLVSDATAAFQMASFFDSDAPARAVRVQLPADTSPAGLRKYDKNAAFVISDILCGQIGAINKLTLGDLVRSVLPFPFHKDLDVDIGSIEGCTTPQGGAQGMVCSFSIPIITICALILLLIMVKLLDIIFFWLPFFLVCLPLPKFDAKRELT